MGRLWAQARGHPKPGRFVRRPSPVQHLRLGRYPEAVGRQSALLATALCAKPMSLIDAFGYLAATISTLSFVPQVWHTFKTRNVSGISLGMYSVFTVGVSCWLVYGLLLGAWPIIIANAITLTLAISILVMKLRFR